MSEIFSSSLTVKADRTSKGGSAGGLLKVLLLVPFSIYLGWLVVRASAAEASLERAPGTVSMASPNDPRIWMRDAEFELLSSGFKISPLTEQRVRQGMTRMPLSATPFVLAATKEISSGRAEAAEILLEEARRRAPRSRISRLLLLDRYLRTSRTEEALAEMQVLMRLIPQAEDVLALELAKYVKDEGSRATLKRMLASDQHIERKVLDQLAKAGTDPEIIMAVASGPALRTKGAEWQARLVEAVMKRGEIARAHGLWARFSGVAATDKQTIYDPQFKGLPGSPPFNWHLSEGSIGVATPAAGGGLNVEFFGRESGKLAEQLLLLSPGRYRLSFRADGHASADGGKLVWVVSCYGSDRSIVELPVPGGKVSQEQVTSEFSVPSGCSSQWLSLRGVAAEFATPQVVSITDLGLDRLS